MADVTKRFRWGLSVEKILDHFTTPEIHALRRHCRKLIRDFRDLDLEGEGYRCSRIPFEMFHYGFVLVYDDDEEQWVLEVLALPDYGSADCPRKRPRRRKDGGARRNIANDIRSGRFRAALQQRILNLYNTLRRASLTLTALSLQQSAMAAYAKLGVLLYRMRRPHTDARVAGYILLFNSFAEQQSQGCRNLVQLVRFKVNEALSFLGPVSTYGRAALRADELWDSSLFGEAEAASG